MLRRLLTSATAALAMSLGASTAASAAVINFDTHTTYTGAGTSFAEGGMNFGGLELYFIPPDWMIPSGPSTFDSPIGTPVLAASTEPLIITLTSGAPFSLQSVDMGLGWYNLPDGDSETIVGTLANCTPAGPDDLHCQVSDTFHVGFSFKTYDLTPDFSGLSSVTFEPMTTQDFNGFAGSGWIGYDNITFNSPGEVGEPVAAPEPAAWSLMILGFAAVGGLMRRRRRAAGLVRAA